jgi:hypothetical protein
LIRADSARRTVVPGRPEASRLFQRVLGHGGPRMPPDGAPLPPQEVALLRRWIASGAVWPQHWSLKPIARPAVPAVRRSGWARNPIDRFILARLEKEGLHPSPEADPVTLIRRLSLDLTGLPPTPEEVEAFIRECREEALSVRPWALGPNARAVTTSSKTKGLPLRPDAQRPTPGTLRENADPPVSDKTYGRLVDRLLASPHYGERWGRHWLDLARYADSDGYEVDKPRPNAWYYRDWVIRAVNEDLPYDQFTLQQLAGDLLAKEYESKAAPSVAAQAVGFPKFGIPRSASRDPRSRDPHTPTPPHPHTPTQASQPPSPTQFDPREAVLATAFHRQTLTNNEGGVDAEEYRTKAVIDRVSTTASIWLGLTAGCAQCHDHPSDALTQREFYGLYAFLNNADETELELARPNGNPVKVAVLAERTDPRTTYLFRRGEFLRPERSAPILPAAPAFLPPLRPRHPGRADRLDLARWLVDPANPLAARTAVNEVWQRLFGHGLVATPDDFGATGDPPSHPGLLDWLASVFASTPASHADDRGTEGQRDRGTLASAAGETHRERTDRKLSPSRRLSVSPSSPKEVPATDPEAAAGYECGWSRKKLIRLIVTSAAYRQSSALQRSPVRRHQPTRLTPSVSEGMIARTSAPNQAPIGRGLAPVRSLAPLTGESTPLTNQRVRVVPTKWVAGPGGADPQLVDPKNRWLWRQNRLRVEAEIVRDLHLAASGLLNRTIGGPSVFPPIPPDLERISFRSQLPWRTSQGADRYRRGMYTFFKRSLPDPNLVVFDCPDSNSSLARRNSSNTPLQALAVMNNQVYVEATRAMARRLLREAPGSDAGAIERLFRLCVARPPRSGELSRLRELLVESRTWYRQQPAEARKLIGEAQPGDPDPAELAAWVVTAGTVMNLDEFVTRE